MIDLGLRKKWRAIDWLRTQYGMEVYAVYDGDYVVAVSQQMPLFGCLRLTRTDHSVSLGIFKAPKERKGKALLEDVLSREFEERGWERVYRIKGMPFHPRNLFFAPIWKEPPVPVRITTGIYKMMGSAQQILWTFLYDAQGQRYLLLMDADSQLVLAYPANFWRM
jgi:hypothetical protein